MSQQHRLQLGRGDLVALVLDQLLEPVDDGEVAVLVGEADVAGAQPAIERRSFAAVCVRLAQIPLHHLRPAQPELTGLARSKLGSAFRVDYLALGVGDTAPDRSKSC